MQDISQFPLQRLVFHLGPEIAICPREVPGKMNSFVHVAKTGCLLVYMLKWSWAISKK